MTQIMTPYMQDYSTFVEALAREKKDKTFFNSGPNHAAIVMSRIFKYSDKIVRIFCGGFNGTVSNDSEYLQELENFLKKGGRLEILVENDLSNNSNSKIFRVLKKYSGQVDIFLTTARVKNEDFFLHFAVGDTTMLRIETNVDDYTAQVNFGNEQNAAIFIDVFNQVLNQPINTKINLDTAA